MNMKWWLMLCVLLALRDAAAEATFPNRLQGDLGGLIFTAPKPIAGATGKATPVPYLFLNYERAFARIDTFGIKTLPLGYGHLELAGRASFDGYDARNTPSLQGLSSRQNSVPLGLGTFQLTPAGALFLYALRDVNQSQGGIFEALYSARLRNDWLTLYPQIRLMHLNPAYTRYYYGVSAHEAASSGHTAYTPAAATNPALKIIAEIPLGGGWRASMQLQREWLHTSIRQSPLVDRAYLDSGFIAAAYRFE